MKCSINKENQDRSIVNDFSYRFKLPQNLCEYIYAHGIDSINKAERFFSCNIKDFHDPYLLKGMTDAVEKIRSTIANGKKIVVFGDYDADGVCASAILCSFLKELGADVDCYIPTREDGYGISEEAVEYIAEQFDPSLIITVDCGISAAQEVQMIQDIGMEIIVTDHHNIPEEIPECIVINPKLGGQEYPFSELCGAGVALKLAFALDEKRAVKYIDFAAIATVADSVPLLDENRLIVKLGLLAMENSPKPYIDSYFSQVGRQKTYTVMEIAYYLAPLINAAGRMENAYIAYEFLTASTRDKADEFAVILCGHNEDRKKLCDEHTEKLIKKITDGKRFSTRAVIVKSKQIPKGIIGIIASKLVEAYHKPAFVFTDNDGVYHGSIRSVDGIDIYSLLEKMSHLFISFGGHKMAAGVTIEGEYFSEFVTQVEALLNELSSVAFVRDKVYDIEIDNIYLTPNFATSVKALEPFGVGFSTPSFLYKGTKLDFYSFSSSPRYMKVTLGDIQAVTFNGEKHVNNFTFANECELLLELDLYKSYLNAVVSETDASMYSVNEDALHAKYLEQLYFEKSAVPTVLKEDFISELDSALSSLYGTAIVINTRGGFDYFNNEILSKLKNRDNILSSSFVFSNCGKSQNVLLFGGGGSLDYQDYTKIFFVDTVFSQKYLDLVEKKCQVKYFVSPYNSDTSFLLALDTSKSIFGRVFTDIKESICKKSMAFDVLRWYSLVYKKDKRVSLCQFNACILTFLQLRIFEFDKTNGVLTYNSNVKAELSSSVMYRNLLMDGE